MSEMKEVIKKLSELKRPKHNVRIHGDQQIKEYIRSVEMFGQIRPLVIDEDGVVLAGNGLWTALEQMGRTTAKCYVVKGLSEAGKKKLMLVDNKIFDLGVNSQQAFDDILKELDGDIDIPGYDPELLSTLSASLAVATEKINDYGKFSNEAVEKMNQQPNQDPAPASSNSPSEGEGAPVSNNTAEPPTGEAMAQEGEATGQEYEAEVQTDEEGREFIICPCCGEKIWL